MTRLQEPFDAADMQAFMASPGSARAERLDHRAFTAVRTRSEAEYLMMLDHAKSTPDFDVEEREWRAFFVESMVEYLIWQHQPWGSMAEAELDWFIGLAGDAPSPSLPALLFALVREMNDVPERLIALALKHPKGRLPALV